MECKTIFGVVAQNNLGKKKNQSIFFVICYILWTIIDFKLSVLHTAPVICKLLLFFIILIRTNHELPDTHYNALLLTKHFYITFLHFYIFTLALQFYWQFWLIYITHFFFICWNEWKISPFPANKNMFKISNKSTRKFNRKFSESAWSCGKLKAMQTLPYIYLQCRTGTSKY